MIRAHQPKRDSGALKQAGAASRRRGFTLVELMVAVTGGLFVSLAVFAIARESGRFYNRESRVSDATLASMLGFERLKADIERAGFLGTPNIRQEPHLCGNSVLDVGWPNELKRMAAVRIDFEGSPPLSILSDNGLHPDSIVLSGSYSGAEQFPIWNVDNTGTEMIVYLQQKTGPLGRMGYETSPNQAAILTNIFGAGRGLRIQDQSGEVQFGTITSIDTTNGPAIHLSYAPKFHFRQDAGELCGLKGNVTGAMVNVVNFVKYDVRNLETNSNLGGANAAYAPVYSAGSNVNFDTGSRSELVRVELDTAGTPIAGTEELVAEYAVDLKFGVTVANTILNGQDPTLLDIAPSTTVEDWAGDVNALPNPVEGPHRVRAIRTRLAVRSQEPDRAGNPVVTGLFRIDLTPAAPPPHQWARVRTVQADVALPNQTGVMY